MKEIYEKYPELQTYLLSFVRLITIKLSSLKSIISFGGITLDNFSIEISDIDIVIFLKENMI